MHSKNHLKQQSTGQVVLLNVYEGSGGIILLTSSHESSVNPLSVSLSDATIAGPLWKVKESFGLPQYLCMRGGCAWEGKIQNTKP